MNGSGAPTGRRRQYDSRHTFISLIQAAGARKNILRWVTHGSDGDIVSLYRTLPSATLCEELAKLKIGLRKGTLGPRIQVEATEIYYTRYYRHIASMKKLSNPEDGEPF